MKNYKYNQEHRKKCWRNTQYVKFPSVSILKDRWNYVTATEKGFL